MKKVMVITAIAAFFSTMASANSGLADRINEARTYPNKTVEIRFTKNFKEHARTKKNSSKINTEHNQHSEQNVETMSHKHS
ncbi:hypothetical protein RE428_31030 [Marinobacter nanhaiticus D15-8W]|jgi:hypothetical protein|uniref:Secreted protein n=1 Tax=Marinobacter adhaerens TaxID=1033846 RepID=A0ABX8IP75_9GAMM|nr:MULTISPECIES: hypothetical protein [Marinobacter]MBW4979932.1 hypothetical protein [Marinobacter adhaerens]QWV15151.1 hypothetical protein KQ249_04940 [Marinobacter adhaerens]BES72085.1 hypothetical protein RE428_31030 [Marinobacter nanhaiticus D15-8W]